MFNHKNAKQTGRRAIKTINLVSSIVMKTQIFNRPRQIRKTSSSAQMS